MARSKKPEYIRLAADLQTDSIVDGPGLRAVLWTQGCSHHCKGCHNPETWDFEGGGLVPISMVKEAIDELEYQSGLTLSGGDPMYQPEAILEIIKYAKTKNLNIWLYTGFLYEEIQNKLCYIDVVVDGLFEIDKRTLDIHFVGSSNQRIIHLTNKVK